MKLNLKRIQPCKKTSNRNGAEIRREKDNGGEPALAITYLSLEIETRAGVETECAAFHLNRQSQTLRVWACKENGPLRPLRINGRLMWPTSELRRLCGVTL